jgi:hypothetical protein
MNGDRIPFGSFSQPVGIGFDVSFFCKADLPIVSTLNDVDGKSRGTIAITSRHVSTRNGM